MHLAAVFGWLIEGLDAELAFIESEIDSEIYVTLPKGATQTSTDSKREAYIGIYRHNKKSYRAYYHTQSNTIHRSLRHFKHPTRC
jgi:hypothetical protein